MLRRLIRWLFRSRRPLHHLQFVMYTRDGCHLCDEAWQLLVAEQRSYGFNLKAVDVDAEPELRAEYGEWVPVVTVNGEVRFRGGLNRVLLKRLLDAESRSFNP